MTPSEWLSINLSHVLVAVAQAGAALAGSATETVAAQADAHLQAGSQDV